jgi:uncharacterized protein (TIGR02678 family)
VAEQFGDLNRSNDAGDPQAAQERLECARHLMMKPFTCAEQFPEVFRLIRRHHRDLDQWFTQRLGYRLHLDADTARLFKSGIVPEGRSLRTKTGRALHRRELQLLALVLASTAAGPLVVSLRDLIGDVRSAATEAGVPLVSDASERRAIVAVLRWMVDQGLATELHEQVDRYVDDADADAVLRMRPDRIALVPLTGLLGETSAVDLLMRADRRDSFRQWVRCHLAEDPVVYRADLTETEWTELRRRLGEESRMLDEMFGLTLEVRAEGVAAIDASGSLSDIRFPSGGTVGHCALLLIEKLPIVSTRGEVEVMVAELAIKHRTHWAKDSTAAPERLTREVLSLLVAHRLVQVERLEGGLEKIRRMPVAHRFAPKITVVESPQEALW